MTDELVALATQAPSDEWLAERLQGLSPDDHANLQMHWLRHDHEIRTQLFDGGFHVRFAMLAASFATTPKLLSGELTSKVRRAVVHDDVALDHIAVACAARGRQWSESLLRLLTKDEEIARQSWPLTSRIAAVAGLPTPTDLGSWLGRFRPPRSGQEHWLFNQIIAELATLAPRERSSAVAALQRALTSRTHESWRDPLRGWAVPLLLEVGGTPLQLARAAVGLGWDSTAPRDHLVRLLLTRDREFVRAFLDAALKSPTTATQLELVDPLIDTFRFPIPDSLHYLDEWTLNHASPRPGVRWVERFVAATRVPNQLVKLPDFQEPMRLGLAELRAAEPVDDLLLLRSLLDVLARGDRRGPQRQAWRWLTGLGLTGLLMKHRDLAIAAAPHTDSSVLRSMTAQFLANEVLDEAQLTQLALAVLPRKEREAKRTMLRALARITTPSSALTEHVTTVAADPDPPTAALAVELLTQWSGTEQRRTTTGPALWRDPAATPPAPLPEFEPDNLVVDAAHWQEILLVTQLWPQPVVAQERALAALVATAHARGVEALAEFAWGQQAGGVTRDQLFQQLGGSTPEDPEQPDRLSGLLHRRTDDLAARLGQLPGMISAPSHTGLRLSWEALAARVERYRQAGQAAVAADVAVALGRLDPATVPDDLSPYRLPIDGRRAGLDEVLAAWRDAPASPVRLTLLPPPEHPLHGREPSVRAAVEVDGDEPGGFDLLGITSPWNTTFRPQQDELPWAHALLPNHPSRGAAVQLRVLEGTRTPSLQSFLALAEVAAAFGPVLGLATVVIAADAASKDRQVLAEVLVRAWDEGRLRPEDLTEAWQSPHRQGWPLSMSKLTMLLEVVAASDGLPLAWPLLTAVAEELSAQSRMSSTTAPTLETVLLHLTEVPDPAAMPNVVALAEHDGKSKAARIAQRIVAFLKE